MGYHNHDFEFAPWDGGILLDTLLAVDARVRLELDTFWAMYALSLIPISLRSALSARTTTRCIRTGRSPLRRTATCKTPS